MDTWILLTQLNSGENHSLLGEPSTNGTAKMHELILVANPQGGAAPKLSQGGAAPDAFWSSFT